jgi:lipoprotein signal peptidase
VADDYWPVFTVADSAVCVGATMLFISTFFKRV